MIGMRALCLALAFLSTPAYAKAPPAWKIRQADSRITFQASQMGTSFEGRIERYTYDIRLDPAHPETGSAKVSIDIASLLTGDKDRDAALPTPEWFDAKKFPEAVFVSDSFKSLGEKNGVAAFQATGTLTIKGIAVPVTLPFTLELKNMPDVEKTLKSAHVKGTLSLDRSLFHLGAGEWADPSVIGNAVTVNLDLMAFSKY